MIPDKQVVSMSEINSVAILGAGAMGAFYAERFSQAPGFSPFLVARGERYERLKKNGLIVNGKQYRLPVLDPATEARPADLIIVALKHHHLPEATPGLRPFLNENTCIISVMNGLDSEDYLGSVLGPEKVLYAIAVGIDAVREGNSTTYTNPGRLFFGEAENAEISARVRRLGLAFDRAGIPHETPPDMMRTLWWKFMVNVGTNQASAVMRAPYGVFQTSAHARTLMLDLMREVIALARAAKVNLNDKDIDDWETFLHTLSPEGKTSMLQDMEAGRKTEVDIFAGKMMEMGRAYGVPTPVNQTLLNIITVLESAGNE